jgi:hypothetical protein
VTARRVRSETNIPGALLPTERPNCFCHADREHFQQEGAAQDQHLMGPGACGCTCAWQIASGRPRAAGPAPSAGGARFSSVSALFRCARAHQSCSDCSRGAAGRAASSCGAGGPSWGSPEAQNGWSRAFYQTTTAIVLGQRPESRDALTGACAAAWETGRLHRPVGRKTCGAAPACDAPDGHTSRDRASHGPPPDYAYRSWQATSARSTPRGPRTSECRWC